MRTSLIVTAIILSLADVAAVRAQGTWRTQELCECRPEAFVHSPVIGGFVTTVRHNGPPTFFPKLKAIAYWRSADDGSWKMLIDSLDISPAPDEPHLFEAISSEVLLTGGQNGFYVSPDSGKTWTLGGGSNFVLALEMFTSDSGYKMALNPNDRSVETRLTYGSILGFTDLVFAVQDIRAIDGYFAGRDTAVILAWDAVHFTTNRGTSWSVQYPSSGFDSTTYVQFGILARSTDPSRLYVTQGFRAQSDFFFTTDFGSTWQQRAGRFSGRLARIAESSATLLWALAMDTMSKTGGKGSVFQSFTGIKDQWYGPSQGDTILYSTDQGVTWTVESKFIGDTITHLVPGVDGQVYVVHYKSGKTYISTFTPGPSSVEVFNSSQSNIRVYPNPSSTGFKMTMGSSQHVRLMLISPLGQTMHEERFTYRKGTELEIKYPVGMKYYSGPLFLVVDAGGARYGQLLMKD